MIWGKEVRESKSVCFPTDAAAAPRLKITEKRLHFFAHFANFALANHIIYISSAFTHHAFGKQKHSPVRTQIREMTAKRDACET